MALPVTIFKLLRKYWYVALIAAAVLALLGWVIYESGKDPRVLLREYGYFVILGWTFLEGETIVIIAGVFSRSLGLEPWLIALCAFCGSFCSDQVMFSLGKYKGASVLDRFPRIAKNMDKASGLFKKYDTALILGFRFVYGVRNITPIMLGISGVSHKKFFALNIIGAGVWAVTFTFGGVFLGGAFMHYVEKVGFGLLFAILGIIVLVGLIFLLRSRRAVKHARAVAAASPVTSVASASGQTTGAGMSILLTNASLGTALGSGGETTSILIEDGVIKKIATNLSVPDAEVYDCAGALVLPSFIDAHVHLDKTRIGDPRLHHVKTASVMQRAANEKKLRKELNHDPRIFGARLVRQLIANGTTHIRSHVDIDTQVELTQVEAVLDVREQFKGIVDIQLVAFPQSGIIKSPGALELMAKALDMGVDIIGGIDPQVFEEDLDGHLDAIFGLAEKTGKPLDIHLHEPAQVGLKSLRAIMERAKVLGMKDTITISHCYTLGQIPDEDLAVVLPQVRDLGISVLTSAPGPNDFPNVEKLLDAGIRYAAMSDNIQDMWSPWGNGDQLERAMLLAYRHGFRADNLIMLCYEMVTSIPAQILGVPNHGLAHLKEGAPANLTALHAEDIPFAVLQRPPRLFTIRDGRFIAKDGIVLV